MRRIPPARAGCIFGRIGQFTLGRHMYNTLKISLELLCINAESGLDHVTAKWTCLDTLIIRTCRTYAHMTTW